MSPRLKDFVKIATIKDGELGVTYRALFGSYLEDVESVTLVDPYLRTDYQMKNLEDFLALLATFPKCRRVSVVTMYAEQQRRWSQQYLDNLRRQFAEDGLDMAYRFDPLQHDRFIETDKHYISLGRGLDLFYLDSPFASLHQRQKARTCKIIYIPKDKPYLLKVG